MNIVFVGPFGLQPKGTVSVRALPLARALAQKGHTVTLLIPPWDDPARAGQQWREDGVRVLHTPLPPGIPLLFHILLTHALVSAVLNLRPQVVHFFKPKGYAGLAHVALSGLRRLGVAPFRLVLDADDWEQAWNDVLPYSAVQKRLFAWQENWGIRHADAVTVASRELESLAGRLRNGAGGITYLPNGWPQAPPPAPSPEAIAAVRQKWQLGDAPTILLYSRFAEFGPARIVELVRGVAGLLPAARWLVVGQGLYGEDRHLAQLLDSAGLGEAVRFTGWPVDNLAACMAAAHVAVHPYDDTLLNRTKCSVKLTELMLAGLPVVADAVGQNREYITPGETGVLVAPGDAPAFCREVVSLLQSAERRRALGQAAARRVRREFNWARLSDRAERVYVK